MTITTTMMMLLLMMMMMIMCPERLWTADKWRLPACTLSGGQTKTGRKKKKLNLTQGLEI
jgi:hypothetical protein